MKKRTLMSMAIVAVIATGILVINACSKNDSMIEDQMNQQTSAMHLKDFTPADEEIIPLIKEFNSSHKQF